MGSDAKEIYEAVLGEIKQELARLVPQYKESIIEVARYQYVENVEEIKRQIQIQLNELKQQNENLENTITALTKRVQGLERSIKNNSGEAREVLSRSEKSTNVAKDKINMSRYRIGIAGFKFNGWIYYANDEMGDFLYKVRLDGTDNQQLTDYSVQSGMMNVKNGKLYYHDHSYREHAINL